MVQEQLASHQVKGKVVESPPQEGHPNLVVKALEGDVGVVAVPTLPTQDGKTLDGKIETNDRRGAPPDDRVADEVDLSGILTPEVYTAKQKWPGGRT